MALRSGEKPIESTDSEMERLSALRSGEKPIESTDSEMERLSMG